MSQDLDDAPLAAHFARHADAGVRRVTLDIGGEQVSLFTRQARLRALCTCGQDGCEHLLLLGATQDVVVESGIRPLAEPAALQAAAP